MFSYTAYNLNISSALPLPELPASRGNADVVVRFGRVAHAAPDGTREGLIHASAGEAYLFFGEVGKFLILGGREIVVDPLPGVDERWIRTGVLGPSLGALLYQRGWLTLHASCVAVDGGAVAFIAERGWGKSTTAAAMCARGHPLVADDMTAVHLDGGGPPLVYPGYPQLKLWPEAAASLGTDPEDLPRLDPVSERRAQRDIREFSADPLPLRRVYVLGSGDALGIEHLQPQEALLELIRHTYGRELFQAVGTRSHFLKCAGVVGSVAVRLIERPYSLALLDDIARLVEEDLLDESPVRELQLGRS